MEAVQTNIPNAASQEDTLKELLRYEKKNLRINRIKLLCALACVVLCAIVAVVLIFNVNKIVQRVETVSEIVIQTGDNIDKVAKSLNDVDFEALSTSAQAFADVGTETIEQIRDATTGLDEVMEQLKAAAENISDININELNNGIKTLNDILDPMAKFFGIFR